MPPPRTPRPVLARKSNKTPAKLCYGGQLLMENRNALIVDIELTQANGYAERATAPEMVTRLPRRPRRRAGVLTPAVHPS